MECGAPFACPRNRGRIACWATSKAVQCVVPLCRLSELTYEDINALERDRVVCMLPVGATEAHGPHLPLGTDDIIADAMCVAGADAIEQIGLHAVILPALSFTHAGFAQGFPGTLSMQPETVRAMLVDIARSLMRIGPKCLILANAHLDPGHIGSLRQAIKTIEADTDISLDVLFPDITRRPYATWLGDEFRSGACHAGCYEGSMVLAARPELVRDRVRAKLPAHPRSLSDAIAEGLTSFEAAGGTRAYFGHPAAASAEEGRERIKTLGRVIAHALEERYGSTPNNSPS